MKPKPKKSQFPFLWLVCLFSLVGLSGCGQSRAPVSETTAPASGAKRLIATTPSIAEAVFELGAGDRLVGVCRFCEYPEEVEKIPKIGGLLDRDNEEIIRLQPDLVIELEENLDSCKTLRNFGIEVLTVNHKSIEGILDSFLLIGERLGGDAPAKAAALRERLIREMNAIREQTEKAKPVRTLISIDRERQTGKLLSVFVAGKNPFFEEIIRIAGGTNVAKDALSPFQLVSVEEILRFNPEVIIDICPKVSQNTDPTGKDDWKTLGDGVAAVRDDRIYSLSDDYASIPGPRFLLLIQRFAEILHPEIKELDQRGVPAK